MRVVLFSPSVNEAKPIIELGYSVVIAGVTKTNAVASVFMEYMKKPFDIAILTGVAGTYMDAANIGNIYSISTEHFADEGFMDGGKFTGVDEIGYPITKQGNFVNLSVIDGMDTAISNTVSYIPYDDDIKKQYMRTGAMLENMEGASFALACNMLAVKCYEVRAISNNITSRDNQVWDVPVALNKIQITFKDIISKMFNLEKS